MAKQSETEKIVPIPEKEKMCGIIMPISQHPDYPINQWDDVLNIVTESISNTQFKSNLVSADEAIGLIHERIVTNVYNNEMIVCDVSSKNPNVMFELGLRLAFDKPIIIIKDDKTSYTFDTGVIEHITYPSSLRFSDIVNFKTELSKKIDATYQKSQEDPDYSPFLRGFGKTIKPASIHKEEVSETKYLIDQIYGLKDEMRRLRFDIRNQSSNISEMEATGLPKPKNLADITRGTNLQNNISPDGSIAITRDVLRKMWSNLSDEEINRMYENMQKTWKLK